MSGPNRLKVALLRVFYRLINWWGWRKHRLSGLTTAELEFSGPAGTIPARQYDAVDSPRALILYIHGGGWVIGDLQTHDAFCRKLARDTGSRVISIHYRRAPEHPFPAAAEDCLAVLDQVLTEGERHNPQKLPLFVAGDSAGGNLSAIVAQQRPAALAGQILIYPATQHYSHEMPSYEENGKGYGLTRALMTWFWDSYLHNSPALEPGQIKHPLATPAWETINQTLPPAILLTAGFDPLRDEGIAYAQQLQQAGVECLALHYPEALHGFLCSEGPVRDHELAMGEISRWLERFRGNVD